MSSTTLPFLFLFPLYLPLITLSKRRAYMDRLCHVQVALLRATRAGLVTDERSMRALQLTINGVSAGLRNSG